MTHRERSIAALTFKPVDRIPFEPGWPRESTLNTWRTQGLPAEGNWFDHLTATLGIAYDHAKSPWADLGVDFTLIPRFEEKVIEHDGSHFIVQDYKGNICEIADTFDVTYLRQAKDFVTRRWIRCPVESRADWEAMKERYRLDSPGRFPADFAARCERAKQRDYLLTVSVNGPFWQLREWCGFEGLCMLMADDPGFVDEMAAFWNDFVAAMLERVLKSIAPDRLYISEDMAYKAKAMISPAMTRRFCMPCWMRWTALAKAAGVPLIDMDSDGFVGELIPLWIESGINVSDPVEVAAHNDINEFRALYGERMAFRMGVDKRAMAKGGQAIRDELDRIAPVVRGGGFIPGCDHGVPGDVSWPAFIEYAGLLARMTGWL